MAWREVTDQDVIVETYDEWLDRQPDWVKEKAPKRNGLVELPTHVLVERVVQLKQSTDDWQVRGVSNAELNRSEARMLEAELERRGEGRR